MSRRGIGRGRYNRDGWRFIEIGGDTMEFVGFIECIEFVGSTVEISRDTVEIHCGEGRLVETVRDGTGILETHGD